MWSTQRYFASRILQTHHCSHHQDLMWNRFVLNITPKMFPMNSFRKPQELYSITHFIKQYLYRMHAFTDLLNYILLNQCMWVNDPQETFVLNIRIKRESCPTPLFFSFGLSKVWISLSHPFKNDVNRAWIVLPNSY